MEDHFDKILYLIIGILYIIFSHSNKHAPEEQPIEEAEDTLPPLPSASDWGDRWDQRRETTTPVWDKKIEIAPAPNLQPKPALPLKPATTTRRLNRYNGWKKAIVMSEILRPYS